jgi:hypothetical protein
MAHRTYPKRMTRLGVRDGEPLVVDLRGPVIDSWDELWDALQEPCGLPAWFGRNLDAWNETLGEGGISAILDAHPTLLVRVTGEGLFAPDHAEGRRFVETTQDTGQGRVEVEPPS